MLALYQRQQILSWEHSLQRLHGSDTALMEQAGHKAWLALHEHWPHANQLWVCVGPGHNGGDGWVLARYAAQDGCRVRVLQTTPPISDSSACHHQQHLAQNQGIHPEPFRAESPPPDTILVDALFGSGLNRPLHTPWHDIVRWMNALPNPVCALDVPSGLDSDTGAVLGCAVRADLSCSFIGMKSGLWLGAGPAHAGHRIVIPLTPEPATRPAPWAHLLPPPRLPARPYACHKGDHGRVCVIAGQAAGAALLAAEAALFAGAGCVHIWADRQQHAGMLARCPELILHPPEAPVPQGEHTILVLGCGWLGATGTRQQTLLTRSQPRVLDAGALRWLASQTRLSFPNQAILTPHPGEAAALLNQTGAQIQQNRTQAIQSLQQRYGGSVVLKGANTLVQHTTGQSCRLCPYGSPALATAGSGDVLAGIIAALWAQGMDRETATDTAVCLHGQAAERAAAGRDRGIIASMISRHLYPDEHTSTIQ